MRGPETVRARRVVAAPEALDAAAWPPTVRALRLAPDDVLVLGEGPLAVADPDAIVVDDAGHAAFRLDPAEADALLARHVRWPLPAARPAFAQGAVADLPARLILDVDEVVVLVPAPFAHELAERLGPGAPA